MQYEEHPALKIGKDIIGGFFIFLLSVVVIHFSILFLNSLPNSSFKISTNSSFYLDMLAFLVVGLFTYVKLKSKEYYKE